MSRMETTVRIMEKMDSKMKVIAKSLLSSRTRWDLVRFFHANPFTIHTANGLAKLVGRQPSQVKAEIEALLKQGVLRRLSQDEDAASIYSYEPNSDVRLVVELIDGACGGKIDLIDELLAELKNENPA